MRIFGSKKAKIAAIVLAAGLVLIPAGKAIAGWGPGRPTFTWAHPATYVTFNSITDNPVYGDERPFYDVRDNFATKYSDALTVHDNQEIVFRVYFHNNAAANLHKVAKNTKVRIALPHAPSAHTWSTAHITADNANPSDVGDTADLNGAKPFTVEYIPGTAQLWNNVFRGAALSDSIVTSGAQIGYDKIDGNLPGCEAFAGYVTIHVKVHMPKSPPPPHTPPKTPPKVVVKHVTVLPNTGAANTIGLFAGVSALAAIGHFVIRRRFNA